MIRTQLSIELSKRLLFESGDDDASPPTHIDWRGEKIALSDVLRRVVETRQFNRHMIACDE